MRCVVLDIETTGLSSRHHRITEIGALKIVGGDVVERFHSLVNPCVRIPPFITRLTGIDNRMCSAAPRIEEILPLFRGFLKDDIIVAHNATFDCGFLERSSEDILGSPMLNRRICTRRLANRLLPDLPSKRLESLCSHFRIENSMSHRALSDAHATKAVFDNLLLMLKRIGVEGEERIIEFTGLPLARCRARF